MKKHAYILFLIILVLINVFSLFHIMPKIIAERNLLRAYIVTFKDKIDPTIEEKYDQKKYEHLFIKTKKKLEPQNKVHLITKIKYYNEIKKNPNVASISKDAYNQIEPREFVNEAKLTGTYIDWYDDDYKAVIKFKITGILLLLNIPILIGLGIKKIIKKRRS